MKIIKNNRRIISGLTMLCAASILLSACTTYVQPVQQVPVPGPRFNPAWVPGHYDRFGGWVPGHYRR